MLIWDIFIALKIKSALKLHEDVIFFSYFVMRINVKSFVDEQTVESILSE